MSKMFADLTNKKFGILTVIKRLENHITPCGQQKPTWLCQCDCGNTIIAGSQALKEGITSHCGCIDNYTIDITGQKFGKLTVIKKSSIRENGKNKRKLIYWECQCDCGNKCIIAGQGLRNGTTKSCGCYRLEKLREALAKTKGIKHPERSVGEGIASFNALYGKYKRRAKNRNLEFSLSRERFKELTKGNCYYCGAEPIQANKHQEEHYCGVYVYNGIDRLDSLKGYTEDNVVSCCGECNRGKLARTEREFIDWVKRVYEHSSALDKRGNLCYN